jgi:hypothetical protein
MVNVTTANGGTSMSRIIFTEARLTPTISLVTPATGYPNSTVAYTVKGSNFQPGLTTVNLSHPAFGELPTTIYAVSATQIVGGISFPANAPIGAWKINVTTADGGKVTSAFTVQKLPAPKITSFVPASGFRGTTISFTVTGDYFQPGERTSVRINKPGQPDIPTNLTSVYPTQITGTAIIPAGAGTGAWKLNVTTIDGGNSTLSNAISIY